MRFRIKNKNLIIFFLKNILAAFFMLALSPPTSTFANKFQYTYNNSTIKLSESSFERLTGFFKGNFYSYFLKKQITDSSGIYFAISRDGIHSVISYCDDPSIWNCSEDFAKFQSVKRCEKISKQECYILANNKEILMNGKVYKVSNPDLDNKFLQLNDVITKFKIADSEVHSEIRYLTLQEKNDGDDWEN